MTKMTEIENEFIRAREQLIEKVRKQMLGPGSEYSIPDEKHELITAKPDRRYSCGILFPQPEDSNMVESEDELEDELEANIADDEGSSNESDKGYKSSQDCGPDKYDKYHKGESQEDDSVKMVGRDKPASFGLAFFVKGNPVKLRCSIEFGMYRHTKVEECLVPADEDVPFENLPMAVKDKLRKTDDGAFWGLKGEIDRKWIAEQREYKRISDEYSSVYNRVLYPLAAMCDSENGYVRIPFQKDFYVDFTEGNIFKENQLIEDTPCSIMAVRRHVRDDIFSITLMVSNNKKFNYEIRQKDIIFQPELSVFADGDEYTFVDRDSVQELVYASDDEELRLAMLYRDKKCYASGLGTAVNWDVNEDGTGMVCNDFVPVCEMKSMDFKLDADIAKHEHDILSMKVHSDLDEKTLEEKIKYLQLLIDSYQSWIEQERKQLATIPEIFANVAAQNIDDCQDLCNRMQAGLKLLAENPKVQRAFALANRAMFMQRIQIMGVQRLSGEKRRYDGDTEVAEWLENTDYKKESDEKTKWRPFQLAFLLMSLPGIVDEKSNDRMLVDLIWFPTGGGKTEAYLGLAAFVIFYRRLAYPNDYGGTNIIMRYTLRLLTAQQFNRAATLICACEKIRQEHEQAGGARRRRGASSVTNELGTERISIGIWIGGNHTPNNIKIAREKLKKLNDHNGENVFQVLKCPWCGTVMAPEAGHKGGYVLSDDKFYFCCPQEACQFHQMTAEKALPVQVIDQMLYREPPTLLIGTIDKFAMMAWDDNTTSFFSGRGPELIIQDELHLISGPLGSVAGLYETALDYICKKNGHYPKIIASTATIRRAKEQCAALYNRDMRQFPAPGLLEKDSYFAREKKVDYEKGDYGRKYIGLIAAGKHKAAMQILLLANILEAAKALKIDDDDVRDMLWTVTGYFGSLRDLGACQKYADEDIPEELPKVAKRMGASERTLFNVEELTSHVSTQRLNQILDRLEKDKYKTYDDSVDKKDRKYPIDFVLSTNMISVGIDVSRLNVMAVIGQPKFTSEYIQASSRVGRSNPGSVFVMYDAGRSRDKSYYEQFKQFHEMFYRYVEPTGATPFAAPVRERVLSAVLVSVFRAVTELQKDKQAAEFSYDSYAEDIADIEAYLLQRFQEIREKNGAKVRDVSQDIKAEIESFFRFWEGLTGHKDKTLSYGEHFMRCGYTNDDKESGNIRLLRPYGQQEISGYPSRRAMTSMRSVDQGIEGNLIIREDKEWKKN